MTMKPNDNTERRIVDAARTLFIEKGYVATNMSDIAVAAGIKRPALHYYFRTKERLFQTIYGDIIGQMVPKIRSIVDSDRPFIERLGSIIDEYTALFESNPDMPQFFVGEIRRDLYGMISVARTLEIDGYILSLRRALAAEIEKGAVRDVPFRIVIMTLYSQMIFPFLSRNLISELLVEKGESFADFLVEWKSNLLRQMTALLDPERS